MPKQKRVTLEQVKMGDTWDSDARVYIWSNEHRLYWRPDGCGYTGDIRDAGVYSFEDAFDRTAHCDPSKGIEFELAESGDREMLTYVLKRLENGQRDLNFYDDWDEYIEELAKEVSTYLKTGEQLQDARAETKPLDK